MKKSIRPKVSSRVPLAVPAVCDECGKQAKCYYGPDVLEGTGAPEGWVCESCVGRLLNGPQLRVVDGDE